MDQILYEMHVGLVNQLMACAWIEAGTEIEGVGQRITTSAGIMERLTAVHKRPKPKFNF